MTKQPFKVGDRLRSFVYAFEGIATLLKTQHNARIHFLATAVVVSLGFYFELGRMDFCFLLLAISGVWVTEALNTAIEFLADTVSQEPHPLIKKAKDLGAAAVLMAVIGAVGVGLLVFWPSIQ